MAEFYHKTFLGQKSNKQRDIQNPKIEKYVN